MFVGIICWDKKDCLYLVHADAHVRKLQESKLRKERELVDLFVVIKGDRMCVVCLLRRGGKLTRD